jgi:hypothetical protein
LGFSREARMALSAARGSTRQCKPDSRLHSTAVMRMLQVGLEIHNGSLARLVIAESNY